MDLPFDMVETIMSNLPVTPLCRFKTLSREWNTAISTPRFAEIHHPNSRYLFLAQSFNSDVFVLGLEDGGFRTEALVEIPLYEDILCVENGVMLLMPHNDYKTYMLWNPCTRQRARIQPLPYEVDRYPCMWGMSPDRKKKDFKIIVVFEDFYTVFSCKNRSWSNQIEHDYCNVANGTRSGIGVFADGAINWVLSNNIICFDPEDDEFKRLRKPDDVRGGDVGSNIMCLNGRLCLYCVGENKTSIRFWVKKEDCWEVLMTLEELTNPVLVGVFPFKENKILMRQSGGFVIYDPRTKTYQEFQHPDEDVGGLYPFRETLFFPLV